MDRRNLSALFGPLFIVIRSPRTPDTGRDGRPLFRAFGWRVFAGVL